MWLFAFTRRLLPVFEFLPSQRRPGTALPMGEMRENAWTQTGLGTAHLGPFSRQLLFALLPIVLGADAKLKRHIDENEEKCGPKPVALQ
jgi:hypothetical protein